MKLATVLAAVALLSTAGLSSCSSAEPATTTTTPAISTTVPSTTVAPTTVAPISSETLADPAPEPINFECGDLNLYQSGTALYSDGTTGYESTCDTYVPPVEKILWYCDYPETAVYTDGTASSSDPACINDEPINPNPGGGFPYIAEEDRNGDGVVNGYERCGIACGQEPTSGDIQTRNGCEDGYITGPLCENFDG